MGKLFSHIHPRHAELVSASYCIRYNHETLKQVQGNDWVQSNDWAYGDDWIQGNNWVQSNDWDYGDYWVEGSDSMHDDGALL